MGASIWNPANTAISDAYRGIDVTMSPFNAKGDGVTDDTAAWQAAIDYAETFTIISNLGNQRPKIIVPAGNYLLGALVMSKRLEVDGVGKGSVYIQQKAGVTAPLFTIWAQKVTPGIVYNHNVFRGMSIQGNRIDGTTVNGSHAIYCPDTSLVTGNPNTPFSDQYGFGVELEDVVIVGFSGCGLYTGTNRNWNLISKTSINYNNDCGWYGNGYDSRISESDFGLNQNYNLYLNSGGAYTFTDCNIYYANPNSNVVSGTAGSNVFVNQYVNSYVNFTNCAFDAAWRNGLYINGVIGTTALVTVTGGRFYGNSRIAAAASSAVYASSDITINGVDFPYYLQTCSYLLQLSGNPKAVFRYNNYKLDSNIPFAFGVSNTPNILQSDVFEVKGLIPNDTSASVANGAIIRATIAQAAIARGDVKFPAGTYYTDKFSWAQYCDFGGCGEHATVLLLGNGLNTDLVTDPNYEANLTVATNPYSVHDMTLDGNNANNTSGSVCVVMAYWCTFTNVTFQNAATYGQLSTTKNKAGTDISNAVGDNRFINCRFNGNKLGGHFGRDTVNRLADQMFTGCIFSANGQSGAYQMVSERFAGYTVNDCRFYLGFQGDIDATKFSLSQITGCHFELEAALSPSSGTIFASVRVRSWSGVGYRFDQITNNLFWMTTRAKNASDIYCAVYFDQASENLLLTSNTFHTETAITTKRAVHGASAMGGKCYPNSFVGYTTGTEYGTAWANWTRPAVVGSRAGNAALASLLTVLAAEGILTDSSTA